MSCDDLLTNQDLSNAKKDATTINDYVESDQYSIVSKNGKVIRTLEGTRQDAQEAIDSFKRTNKGDYSAGPVTLEDGFEYVSYSGDGKDYFAVTPPYTTDPTTYPDPSTDANLTSLGYVLRSEALAIANAGDSRLSGGKIHPIDGSLIPLGAQSTPIPAGVTRLDVDTGNFTDGETLYLWEPSGDFGGSPQTITNITPNTNGGYDVVTNIQTYVFTTQSVRNARGYNAYPTAVKESSPKGWGAVGEYDTNPVDDYNSLQTWLNWCQTSGAKGVWDAGRYLSNTTLIHPKGVVIEGVYAGIGPDLLLGTTLLTTNASIGTQMVTEETNSNSYQNGAVRHVRFSAEGAAEDNIDIGLDIQGKGVKVFGNNFVNQNTGVKSNAVETWIENNYFNSNDLRCIDVVGECHVNNNHGFPGGAAGTGQRAILVRGSNNEIMGNKFFGDGSGSGADYGIEIWGFGNQVIGNVLDAFVEAPYYLNANTPGVDVQNNTIIGNAYAAGKVGSTIAASVYMNAANANITGNVINIQANNNRGDRQTEYMYYLQAVGAFTIDENELLGGVKLTDINTSVINKVGAGVGSYNRVKIAGYKTVREWEQSVSNGDVINHGIDVTPSHVTMTPRNNTVYNLSYDNETATTIRVLGRDSADALISNEPVRFRASREYA